MTTEVLRGVTRWKFFLQASRSFLNRSGLLVARKNVEKINFKIAEKCKNFEMSICFKKKHGNYHDSRGGTDTPGPGESVSAIRFIGQVDLSRKTEKNEIRKIQQSNFSGQISAIKFQRSNFSGQISAVKF